LGLSEIDGLDNIEIPNDYHVPNDSPNKFEIISPDKEESI
jgi:hypothetical protein